jgi:hypothetical protein
VLRSFVGHFWISSDQNRPKISKVCVYDNSGQGIFRNCVICFRFARLYTVGVFVAASSLFAQGNTTPQPVGPGQPAPAKSQGDKAKDELKQQEHQRILHVLPNFNTSNVQNAAPLSPKQKFHLALKSATDPVQFGITALDAGISQANNSFPGYGQGMQG